MTLQETYLDKLLQKDNMTAVRRLLIGGLMAASAAFGAPYIIATGLSCIVINCAVINHERQIQEKKLTNFYKDEIGELLHKAPQDVTIEDLKTCAKPVAEGGKGIASLQAELDGHKFHSKFRMGVSAISSVLTSAILVALTPVLAVAGGVYTALGLGVIGLGHTVIAKTVRATAHTLIGEKDVDNSVHQKVMRVAEEIKEKPVSPLEIFGLMVDGIPAIRKKILDEYKIDYCNMPVLQKKTVVDASEDMFHTVALTNAVNAGTLKPSMIGFIASGDDLLNHTQLSGFQQYVKVVSEAQHEKVSDKPFEVAPNDVNLSEHRKRLQDEREALTRTKSLH